MEAGNKNMDIFKKICVLVTNPDFGSAQMTFIEKNKESFDANIDENKLEHTQMHTEYVHILEEIIEAQLKAEFTDDEVNNFYSTFPDNMAAYKEENADTMEILYGFIDFQKFKENMLLFKEGGDNKNVEETAQKSKDMGQVLSSHSKKGTEVFDELIQEDVNDKALKWQLVIEKKDDGDGISMIIHKRPMEGKSINLTRSNITMKNIKIETWKNFINNYDKHIKKMDDKNRIVEFRWLENKPEEGYWLMFSESKMGSLASNRENLIEMTLHEKGPKSFIYISKTVERDDIPVKKGCVRMEIFKATHVEQVGEDVVLTEFSNFDLKGYFPSSLFNMVMAQAAKEGMKKFYKTLQDEQAAGN